MIIYYVISLYYNEILLIKARTVEVLLALLAIEMIPEKLYNDSPLGLNWSLIVCYLVWGHGIDMELSLLFVYMKIWNIIDELCPCSPRSHGAYLHCHLKCHFKCSHWIWTFGRYFYPKQFELHSIYCWSFYTFPGNQTYDLGTLFLIEMTGKNCPINLNLTLHFRDWCYSY